MTFLKDERRIQRHFPRFRGRIELTGMPSKQFYKVAYDFVPIINGRIMGYEVRWSPSMLTDGDESEGDGAHVCDDDDYVVLEAGQFSVAAAFRPGT